MSTTQIPTISSFSAPSKAIEALTTKLDTLNRQISLKQSEVVRAKSNLQNCQRRLKYYSSPNDAVQEKSREKERHAWSLRVKEAEGKVKSVEEEVKKLGDVKGEVLRRLESARKMHERQRR